MKRSLILLTLILSILSISSCSEDKQNQLARMKIEYLEGNYKVTFANGNFSKTWTANNTKITSDPKGYYFFWGECENKQKDNCYIQLPIENTIIEEIK